MARMIEVNMMPVNMIPPGLSRVTYHPRSLMHQLHPGDDLNLHERVPATAVEMFHQVSDSAAEARVYATLALEAEVDIIASWSPWVAPW